MARQGDRPEGTFIGEIFTVIFIGDTADCVFTRRCAADVRPNRVLFVREFTFSSFMRSLSFSRREREELVWKSINLLDDFFFI